MFSPVGFSQCARRWTIIGFVLVHGSQCFSQSFRSGGVGVQDVSKSKPSQSAQSLGSSSEGDGHVGSHPLAESPISQPPVLNPPSLNPAPLVPLHPSSQPHIRPAIPSSRRADLSPLRSNDIPSMGIQNPKGRISGQESSGSFGRPSRGVSDLRQPSDGISGSSERSPQLTPVPVGSSGDVVGIRRPIQGLRPGSVNSPGGVSSRGDSGHSSPVPGSESGSFPSATGFNWTKRPGSSEPPKSSRLPFVGTAESRGEGQPTLGLRLRKTPSNSGKPSFGQGSNPSSWLPTEGTREGSSSFRAGPGTGSTFPKGPVMSSDGLKGQATRGGIGRSIDSLRRPSESNRDSSSSFQIGTKTGPIVPKDPVIGSGGLKGQAIQGGIGRSIDSLLRPGEKPSGISPSFRPSTGTGSAGSTGPALSSEGLQGQVIPGGNRRSIDSLRRNADSSGLQSKANLGSGFGIPTGGLAQGNQATFERIEADLARLGESTSRPSNGTLAVLCAGSNISQLPRNLGDLSGWRNGRHFHVPSFHGSQLPFRHLGSVRRSTGQRVLFDASDLRAADFSIRSMQFITPAPPYFRPVVQPSYVTNAFYGYGWTVPSSLISSSFVSGRIGLSWNYFDGRFCYDQVYVGRLLAPLGIVPVGGYDGLIIGGRYYAHGYGWLDGCLYYGSGRVWVPGFWAPQTTEVCEDTYEWIPAQYDWVWTGHDWEWLVTDGGYYVKRRLDSCRTVNRWVWIPGHWQRGWRG
jgi:hypothetical protein